MRAVAVPVAREQLVLAPREEAVEREQHGAAVHPPGEAEEADVGPLHEAEDGGYVVVQDGEDGHDAEQHAPPPPPEDVPKGHERRVKVEQVPHDERRQGDEHLEQPQVGVPVPDATHAPVLRARAQGVALVVLDELRGLRGGEVDRLAGGGVERGDAEWGGVINVGGGVGAGGGGVPLAGHGGGFGGRLRVRGGGCAVSDRFRGLLGARVGLGPGRRARLLEIHVDQDLRQAIAAHELLPPTEAGERVLVQDVVDPRAELLEALAEAAEEEEGQEDEAEELQDRADQGWKQWWKGSADL
ncbi:hypothetical protein DFJ74DRAFT_697259 [Hyaloraphidium curvatum]|nr:hypothetical protein DFJ74DRAFT_697259 [Hyaloraphidium curvatum]